MDVDHCTILFKLSISLIVNSATAIFWRSAEREKLLKGWPEGLSPSTGNLHSPSMQWVNMSSLSFLARCKYYALIINHLLAHVIEETEEARKGVEFLTSTRGEWAGIPFEGHLIWHLTLYYLGTYI